jgi:hypothetical protein
LRYFPPTCKVGVVRGQPVTACAETLDLRLLSDSLVKVFSSSREQLEKIANKKISNNHMLFVLIIYIFKG